VLGHVLTLPWLSRSNNREGRVGCSTLILLVTGVYLVVGLLTFAIWRATGRDAWVTDFFQIPGAFLLVSLAVIQLWYAVWSVREFSPGQPMRTAWIYIACSAACELAGTACVQVLAADSMTNPLRLSARWSGSSAEIRQFGLLAGGTCRFVLLAIGLWWALRVYRESRLMAGLKAVDWALLGLLVTYIVWEAGGMVVAMRYGKHPGVFEILSWPVDPLLCVLLAEAILLFRSVRQMGTGWIGLCWRAMSLGVGLVCLGDILIWAGAYGFVPWPWSALEWYIWLPAAGAFAVAPVYQLEAIYQARTARGAIPSISTRLRDHEDR
jgi:hypothetical protein